MANCESRRDIDTFPRRLTECCPLSGVLVHWRCWKMLVTQTRWATTTVSLARIAGCVHQSWKTKMKIQINETQVGSDSESQLIVIRIKYGRWLKETTRRDYVQIAKFLISSISCYLFELRKQIRTQSVVSCSNTPSCVNIESISRPEQVQLCIWNLVRLLHLLHKFFATKTLQKRTRDNNKNHHRQQASSVKL